VHQRRQRLESELWRRNRQKKATAAAGEDRPAEKM